MKPSACSRARSLRLYRAIELLEGLYDHHGLQPTDRAFRLMLRMAFKLRRPVLARELLTSMVQHGFVPSEREVRAGHPRGSGGSRAEGCPNAPPEATPSVTRLRLRR